MKKINIGIIFGGNSSEHLVSLESAKNICISIDKSKFKIFLIAISKTGTWYLINKSKFLNKKSLKTVSFKEIGKIISIELEYKKNIIIVNKKKIKIEVFFPIIHGPYGEDGSLQGLLNILGFPFVGSGVLSSAIGINKETTKSLLKNAGFNVAPFILIKKYFKFSFDDIVDQLGIPLFIKPNNQGSSLGISKIRNKKEFKKAIFLAFKFSKNVLIEKEIVGKEIECGVLGNKNLKTSICAEINCKNNFYDYQSKYINTKNTEFLIPSSLKRKEEKKIRNTAKKIFKILKCSGMARIDFFFTAEKKIIVNEINTIPGFTRTSIYPKMWKFMGINCTSLISKLIFLAIQNHKK